MRYRVKDREGNELSVPSLGDLVGLYRQGFLDDEDLVRRETSTEWERAGSLEALEGQRERRREPRAAWSMLLGAVTLAIALAIALLLRAGR